MEDIDRLTRLEERYAHLQRHVVQQDKVMLELSDELAKLRQELALVRLQQGGGGGVSPVSDDTANERPPHY